MPYIYRYIDLDKRETVYIGKVTQGIYNDQGPLIRRHQQHMRETWYKEIKCPVFQYISCDSHTDADILETWLIQFYPSEQLVNKGKTGWGSSEIDLYPCIFGRWKTFNDIRYNNREEVQSELMKLADSFYEYSDGLRDTSDAVIEVLINDLKELRERISLARKMTYIDGQDEFKRNDNS